jgi:hypothetical protein
MLSPRAGSAAGPGRVLGDEAGFLHERAVHLLVLAQPVEELLAGQRGLAEGALVHELLPLGRGTHLREEIEVVLGLIGRHARRHEDAAQHHVLRRNAGRRTRRQVAPGLRGGDLVLVGQLVLVEDAQRAQLAGAPVRLGLDRVVHRRIDVLADQLHGHVAAALERHVGHLLARGLLEHHGDDLVFLLGAGAAHLELVRAAGLDRVEVLLRRLVG